jgi:crossover junction endodeoxyribonuclease RuvC
LRAGCRLDCGTHGGRWGRRVVRILRRLLREQDGGRCEEQKGSSGMSPGVEKGHAGKVACVRLIVAGLMRGVWKPLPIVSVFGRLFGMRVFGVDCGTEFTGYGVVETGVVAHMPKLLPLCSGAVRLNKKDPTAVRLAQVYAELTALMQLWQPEIVAIEEVFFAANAKSALKLGQVRGVALLAAANCGLPVAEYAPLKIKSSVVGYGLAGKEQVQFMVTRLLDLDVAPEPADAADALAIAICHIHHAQTAEALLR